MLPALHTNRSNAFALAATTRRCTIEHCHTLLLSAVVFAYFDQALRIANKLKSKDSTMYGAYWCTHCFNQKELLGQQAMAKVKYVEW